MRISRTAEKSDRPFPAPLPRLSPLDFRADNDGVIKLFEVNPNPGWCWDGKLNIMAGFAEMSYADMLRTIIEAAQARYELSVK